MTSTKDNKKMETLLQIDALKGCASKKDTCDDFKRDLQENADTVSLNKCKYNARNAKV